MNDKKLTVEVEGNYLKIHEEGNPQNSCSILFHRTLRIPDDGKVYPLPPSLGRFPICKVDDYLDRVPEDWQKTGGVFFPMHQREAMWMQFRCSHVHPKAMKIAVGKVSAITGNTWTNQLEEKDYVTIPKQPWLDGINAGGRGTIKQFVAMPLGSGYSIEAQVTGEENFGGIQLMVFESKESERLLKFPPRPIRLSSIRGIDQLKNNLACPVLCSTQTSHSSMSIDSDIVELSAYRGKSVAHHSQQTEQRRERQEAKEMSLSAGGSMKQEITEDEHGLYFWDQTCFARVYVRIVNSEMYEQITGKKAPPTTITAQTYSSHGYPWFDIYNESPQNSIKQSNILGQVKSVSQIDKENYSSSQQDDSSIQLSASQVKSLSQ